MMEQQLILNVSKCVNVIFPLITVASGRALQEKKNNTNKKQPTYQTCRFKDW